MKKLIAAVLVILPLSVFADPWHQAQSRNAGNYLETYTTSVSSSAATLIVDTASAVKSANVDIFNNSAYTLWIGTNTATLATTGFPILSSRTYTLDGTFTGNVYGLADSAAGGSINERTIYFLKNDALR